MSTLASICTISLIHMFRFNVVFEGTPLDETFSMLSILKNLIYMNIAY